MPHFVHVDSGTFLSASRKVMTTKLTANTGLRAAGGRELQRHVIAQRIPLVPARRHVLIVRDPFTRLESFYRDKFLQDPVQRGPFAYDGWQDSQRLFFPFVGVHRDDAPDVIVEKLTSTSFAQFLDALPQCHSADAHLMPQSDLRRVPLARMRFAALRFDSVVHIEDADEMATLHAYGVDPSRRTKSTHDVRIDTPWTAAQRRTVARLYADDFRRFGYPTE